MSKTQRCSRAVVVAALAGVAIMVCTAPAEAEPIRFDNPAGPGHFEWFGGGGSDPIGLHVMLPPDEQTGTVNEPATFHQALLAGGFTMVAGPSYGDEQHGHVQVVWDAGPPFLVGVGLGDVIPSGLDWHDFGYTNHPSFPGWELPYDQEIYLGIKFDVGSGDQYGWIGGVFSSADLTVDAFAWGYETEVGVSIPAGAVPEPGSLALLAMGAVGVLSRRRK